MERKTFELAEFKVDAAGAFEGYASVFNNVDAGKDVVLPGAFKGALPAFLKDGFISWSHDWGLPIGMPTAASEDDHGLYLAGEFHSTTAGQEARTIASERAQRKLRTGLSIGYGVEQTVTMPNGVRGLKRINPLFEVGFVMVPMNREANVAGVKSDSDTSDDAEQLAADAAKSIDEAVTRFLGDADSLIAEFTKRAELRAAEGRTLSATNLGRLADIRKAADELLASASAPRRDDIAALLEEAIFLGVPLQTH